MAYTRLNLETGDTVEASHVSHIEDGIVSNESDITALNQSLAETKDSLSEQNIFSLGTQIQSGDDLNNYTTPGNYYCSSSSVSATVENTPTTVTGYKLLVFYTAALLRFIQIAFLNSSDNTIQYRIMMGDNTWGSWWVVQAK